MALELEQLLKNLDQELEVRSHENIIRLLKSIHEEMTYMSSGKTEGIYYEFLTSGTRSDLSLVIPIMEKYRIYGLDKEETELKSLYAISDSI